MEARKVFVMWILVWSVIGGYWRCHHWSPAPSGWQESAGPGMRSLFVRSWLLLGGEWIHYQDPWPGLAAAVCIVGGGGQLTPLKFISFLAVKEWTCQCYSHQINLNQTELQTASILKKQLERESMKNSRFTWILYTEIMFQKLIWKLNWQWSKGWLNWSKKAPVGSSLFAPECISSGSGFFSPPLPNVFWQKSLSLTSSCLRIWMTWRL